MTESETQWKDGTFVKLNNVLRRPREARREGKRLTGILRADNVNLRHDPVVVGDQQERIQIAPIVENGRVKALRVVCACGCETTFDIKYAPEGAPA